MSVATAIIKPNRCRDDDGKSALSNQGEQTMDDRVQQFLAQCEEAAAQAAREIISTTFGRCLPDCESDIERLFLAALYRWQTINAKYDYQRNISIWGGICYAAERWDVERARQATRDHMQELRAAGGGFYPEVVNVFPQCRWESYRADFVLVHVELDFSVTEPRLMERVVVVECDGHDFHEKTKWQAERDKGRDRDMTAAGLIVVRFTGSEIWRDPVKCADEALRILAPRGGWEWGGEVMP
jgi:very-short-patch-repair endonuclease